MLENNEFKEDIIIDEKEAKKQFLDELRNKNMEEMKQLEEASKEKTNLDSNLKISIGNEERAIEAIDNKAADNGKINSTVSKKAFKAALIDTAICGVISVIGVYLFDAILRLFGYYVVDFEGVYIIALLIILILYPTIMKGLRYGKTFGQKFSKI